MTYRNLIAVLIISACFISCDNQNKNTNNTASDSLIKEASVPLPALKAGGLYFLKDKNDSFYIVKILVIDDFAVHVRTYRNKFAEKPKDINSAELKTLIGHAPLDKDGFLAGDPELFKVEEVKENELEGYKMYLEAMEKMGK